MQKPIGKRADFTALCLWIIISIVMATFTLLEYGQDFRGYYAAGQVLLAGGNPYDYTQVAQVLLDVTGRAGNNPFYYPLWFGWFITPLSLLPFQVARAVWMFINWALWLIGLLRLGQLLDFPRPGLRRWLLYFLATFVFAWTTWKFEQTGILLFVITVEILIAYQKQHWNRLGFLLALALIKPNVMLIPVAAIAAWLLRNRNVRPVLVGLLVLAAFVLITTALTPNWVQPLLQPGFGQGLTDVLDGPNRVTGTRLNTTLLDWLKWYSVPDMIRNGIYAVAVLVGVLILGVSAWKSRSILDVTAISILVSFAVTPYALQYDYPPLVIVLVWALAAASPIKAKAIPLVIVSFIASVLLWERPISDGYWIVIGLAALTIWVTRSARDKLFTQNSPHPAQ